MYLATDVRVLVSYTFLYVRPCDLKTVDSTSNGKMNILPRRKGKRTKPNGLIKEYKNLAARRRVRVPTKHTSTSRRRRKETAAKDAGDPRRGRDRAPQILRE
jgi:hypothetical protein